MILKEIIERSLETLMEREQLNNKLDDKHLSSDELKDVNRGIQTLTRDRTFNHHIMSRGELPHTSTTDTKHRYARKALDIVFHKKKDLSIDKKTVLYHATRHNVEFDESGHTTIKPVLSASLSHRKVYTHLHRGRNDQEKGTVEGLKQHHALAIHYDPEKHGHIPAVNISQHSGMKSEDEVIMPPHTKFKHIYTERVGEHPETGKQILVHHVEPVETHPLYDRSYVHKKS
jgi:hypothetical protein